MRPNLKRLQTSGEKIAELKAKMQALYKQAPRRRRSADPKPAHSLYRDEQADAVSAGISEHAGIRFALKHARGALSSHGQDNVEFLISTNPGEAPKPLAKIARAASFPALCSPSRAHWPTATHCRLSSTTKSIPAFPAGLPGDRPAAAPDRRRAPGALHHPHPAGGRLCR